jgi:integrase
MATTEPIRNKHQVRELANYCLQRGQFRNHCLIVLGVHSALRVSDLLRLRWKDVYDFDLGRLRQSVTILEKKTGKRKIFALNKRAAGAISLLFSSCAARPDGFLIENPRTGKAISRIQAYRIIRAAAEALKFQNRVSCHSLRKTFGYHAWKSGASPTVLMEIYNHSSFAVTRRYLGVAQDDKDQIYLNLRFSA